MLFNPPSVDLSIIACKKILRDTENGCRYSHLILSCFMQPGPGILCLGWGEGGGGGGGGRGGGKEYSKDGRHGTFFPGTIILLTAC